jgi:hypothetical protein
MAKGWGKSPLLASIAVEEFAGPVRFGGWDDVGEPIAVPVHWLVVEIAAVSEDQTDNTCRRSTSCSPPTRGGPRASSGSTRGGPACT